MLCGTVWTVLCPGPGSLSIGPPSPKDAASPGVVGDTRSGQSTVPAHRYQGNPPGMCHLSSAYPLGLPVQVVTRDHQPGGGNLWPSGWLRPAAGRPRRGCPEAGSPQDTEGQDPCADTPTRARSLLGVAGAAGKGQRSSRAESRTALSGPSLSRGEVGWDPPPPLQPVRLCLHKDLAGLGRGEDLAWGPWHLAFSSHPRLQLSVHLWGSGLSQGSLCP